MSRRKIYTFFDSTKNPSPFFKIKRMFGCFFADNLELSVIVFGGILRLPCSTWRHFEPKHLI